MTPENNKALQLARGLRDFTIMPSEKDEAAEHLERLVAENEALRKALQEARNSVEGWAAYASPYFQEKHNLQGELDAIDALLKEKNHGMA